MASTKSLLDDVLEGQRPTVGMVDDLRLNHTEGLWLDFKSGKLTENKAEARAVLREYVSGFANSDGGILVFGVANAKPRVVSTCSRIGTASLEDWAATVVGDMAPSFSIQPRFAEVAHPDGLVLVVAVPRAPLLIPYTKDGKNVYAIRIGDRTLTMDDYLIADLLLGRRQRPILDVRVPARIPGPRRGPGVESGQMILALSVTLDNVSMIPARGVRLGAVKYTSKIGVREASRVLKASVDAQPLPNLRDGRGKTATYVLTYNTMDAPGPGTVFPMETVQLPEMQLNMFDQSHFEVRFAVYVLAEGALPDWWEVTVAGAQGAPTGIECTVRRCHQERPRVSIAHPG